MDKVERWLPARRSGFVLKWIWASAMLTGLCSLEPFTSEKYFSEMIGPRSRFATRSASVVHIRAG
jgi:hypothetical protein